MKTKNTNPEIKIRSVLFSKGYRFKVHDKKLPGKPDIVLPKHKVIINVNGCFWHRPFNERCSNCRLPKTNKAFWRNKLGENVDRDSRNLKKLELKGWNGLILWECEIKFIDNQCNKFQNHGVFLLLILIKYLIISDLNIFF